ncbi:MAG: DUF1697 domain-containing protein [bacterium]
MTRYVAFLRAINVGGHTVKMDHLRALFDELRLGNVETFIASGNVLFDSSSKSIATLEARIERHLAQALGYEVATFIRPLDSLATVVESHPFNCFEQDGHALSIGFLKVPCDAERSGRLASLQDGYDEFHLREREVYWLCHGRMSDSRVWGTVLDRALGAPVTFRNITTVRKLAATSPQSRR